MRGFDVETPTDTLTTAEVTTYIGYGISTVGAISNITTAGTLNWRGLDFTTPAATVDIASGVVNVDGARITTGNIANIAGTLTENGLIVDMTGTTITRTAGTPTLRGVYLNAGTSENVVSNVLGMEIANLTGAASATETAVQIGSGWDVDLAFVDSTAVIDLPAAGSLTVGDTGADLFTLDFSANTMRLGDGSNGITFDVDGSGTVFAGTARPTRTETIIPEYAGASLTPDGSANSGSMTTDFCSDLRTVNTASTPSNSSPCDSDLSEEHNYYTWTSTSASQDYDIWVRWQVPTNFSGWDTLTDAVQVYGWRTDGTNTVTVSMFDTAGAAVGSATNVATGTGQWTQATVVTTPTGTYTVGGYVTFRIQMANDTANDHVKVGEIEIDYKGKL